MTLSSAVQDLQETTLKAIAGLLRKLEYLAGLQNREGGYTHWGLNRIYGDFAARKAMAHAHSSVLSRILSMPIRKLLEDVEKSSETAGITPETYVGRLSVSGPKLLPPEPGAGSARHFSSVLHALASLQKNQTRAATPPTLWPRRPLGQSLPPLADNAARAPKPAKEDGVSR